MIGVCCTIPCFLCLPHEGVNPSVSRVNEVKVSLVVRLACFLNREQDTTTATRTTITETMNGTVLYWTTISGDLSSI